MREHNRQPLRLLSLVTNQGYSVTEAAKSNGEVPPNNCESYLIIMSYLG